MKPQLMKLNPSTSTWAAAVAAAALSVGAGRSDAAMYALYQFEDASGSVGATIQDSSPFANDGMVTFGDIVLGAGRPGGGNAATVSLGSVVATTLDVDTTQTDYTIAFWMKSSDLSQSGRYITARDNFAGPQLSAIYGYVENQVEIFPGVRDGSQITILDADWHHVVFSRTGSTLDKYIDGALTSYGSNGDPLPSPDQLVVGGTGGNAASNFQGQLDDVAWFNEGVNQSQVNRIMAGDFSQWGGPVPEPSVALLSLGGLIALVRRRR